MLNSVDFGGRPFHFIGIGGIGMSALAHVLNKRKLPVSGSDLSLSHITQRLQDQGVHIFWHQDAANLENRETEALPQVICSTAINPANAEYQAAVTLGCPIFHRSDLLAALMREYRGIAVAGTHGKTTTSSMIGYLLLQAGLDPTIVVGGEVKAWEGNARVGQGPYFVAEADESDGSLVKFSPYLGVITNIELDHPDHYTTLEQVIETFQTFAQQCQVLVGCIDCENVRKSLQPTISYSLNPALKADYTVGSVSYQADCTVADVWERGERLGTLTLALLGPHNLSNALAAIAVGRWVGLEFETIASILTTFEGARRRFEHRGEYHHILFIDDYAHHPSEIQATLKSARLSAQISKTEQRRVVAVFQPHRYSRTQTFLAEFAQAFGDADLVIATDIYSAGEPASQQITGPHVAAAIAAHHPHVVYQPTLQAVSAYLMETLLPGDLVLCLGAGNLNRIIPDLTAHYQQVEQSQQAEQNQLGVQVSSVL
jgi:UDP-N-acetylmuramate--alanine ligase